MEVFITCPSQRDRDAIVDMPGYNFHLLDAPLNPRTPSPDLNLLAYIDQCREYIKTHHIDGVFYSRDIADLAAAAHLSAVDYIGDVPWKDHEGAKNWYSRVKSRPSFRTLLEDNIPGAPPPKHYRNLDF